MKELFPFQQEDLLKLILRRHSLLASEMGMGKTIEAIALINQLDLAPVLIICKASIKINWLRKLNEWLDKPRVVQIINSRTDPLDLFAEIFIVNYDLITHSYIHLQLSQIKWALIVCDEAHSILGPICLDKNR